MASSESNIESGLGAHGSDAAWLSSLSEPELDFLFSLKELVVGRAKTIQHSNLADKFDLKMLRALGIVLLEYFKEHANDACTPKLAETLALFYGDGLDTQTGQDSTIVDENIQPPTFVLPKRKLLWDGLCEKRGSSSKKRKRTKAVTGTRKTPKAKKRRL